MQKIITLKDLCLVTKTAPMAADVHGGRAKCLQRLIRLDMPVPTTVALSFAAVRAIAAGNLSDVSQILGHFEDGPLLSVRPSSLDPDWGGPSAILNIGMNDKRHADLVETLGQEAATRLYMRFVQTFAIEVARLDPEEFYLPDEATPEALRAMLDTYEVEVDDVFPQDAATQLGEVLRSMARSWEGTTARLLRQAKGAPVDAGLGLVVQEMVLPMGEGVSGSGEIQFVDGGTGAPQVNGRFVPQVMHSESLRDSDDALFLTCDERGPSLEEKAPEAFQELLRHGALGRERLREEMQIKFILQSGTLAILDSVRIPRSSRAAVRIAVDLASSGVIPKEEAIMRIHPAALSELLHRQVDRRARRDVLVRGIAASPGAASGALVFTASEAQASAARGEACVLVRRETTPEDIRGMHAAVAVVTLRGGITSHAAVIGRGIGLPCIVGAADLDLDERHHEIIAPDGRTLGQGDMVTVDGTTGQVLVGEPAMMEAVLDDAFQTLLDWADEVRDIGIRANADTPADAQTASNFAAEGIGLCRTEHMFFDGDRVDLMREMIFADTAKGRAAVLERLMPLQRTDFTELFRIMDGKPVCIRLFDPPLHEFLPTGKAGIRELAELLNMPMTEVTARVDDLTEYNPMLGMRGVRLGITVPEIYDMQARAIFQATVASSTKSAMVVPEIMIPLVSAMREVELVKSRIDAVAAAVRAETGVDFDYRLGVMVETPRAALRAEDIAEHSAFLSFGTNDLTQMTYGLSRDDAGRFMSEYVKLDVYPEDPFHTLDLEGVGELLKLGAERGRRAKPDITLSICGEHGGATNAIAFCREQGFDYVSCSPFRVPVARLSAAQLALLDNARR